MRPQGGGLSPGGESKRNQFVISNPAFNGAREEVDARAKATDIEGGGWRGVETEADSEYLQCGVSSPAFNGAHKDAYVAVRATKRDINELMDLYRGIMKTSKTVNIKYENKAQEEAGGLTYQHFEVALRDKDHNVWGMQWFWWGEWESWEKKHTIK